MVDDGSAGGEGAGRRRHLTGVTLKGLRFTCDGVAWPSPSTPSNCLIP
jgi:hypothetical protein